MAHRPALMFLPGACFFEAHDGAPFGATCVLFIPRGKSMSAVGVVKNRAPHSLGPDAFLRFGARITPLPNSKKVYIFSGNLCKINKILPTCIGTALEGLERHLNASQKTTTPCEPKSCKSKNNFLNIFQEPLACNFRGCEGHVATRKQTTTDTRIAEVKCHGI